jgi:hypothetical protein
MNNQKALADYRTYDNRYQSSHNRPCIDGSITGCGKCVAYCTYEQHPGFLTEELKAKHKCVEKQCNYYLPKPRKIKQIDKNKVEAANIISLAISVTNEMEGLRVLRANKNADGTWVIYYVSIAGYILDDIETEMQDCSGENVMFSKLEYNFEIAASIIFDMKRTA